MSFLRIFSITIIGAVIGVFLEFNSPEIRSNGHRKGNDSSCFEQLLFCDTSIGTASQEVNMCARRYGLHVCNVVVTRFY